MPRPDPMDARRGRLGRAGPFTSLLSVPDAVALSAVGFEPVGDVLGANARRQGYRALGGCGRYTTAVEKRSDPYPIRLSTNPFSPYQLLARTRRSGYSTAMRRLADEASALGADGVLGIQLTHRRRRHTDTGVEYDVEEFTATGTAVRARTSKRPAAAFTTHVDATAFVTLLQAGWVPVALHTAVEIGLRHIDYTTADQLAVQNRSVNSELGSVSELVHSTRSSARAMLHGAIASSAGTGGLLGGFDTRVETSHCDFAVHVFATGTAITRFATSRFTAPRPLTVLPLAGANDMRDRR